MQQPRRYQQLSAAEREPLEALLGAGVNQVLLMAAGSMYAWLLHCPLPGLDAAAKAELSVVLTLCVSDAVGGNDFYWPKARGLYKRWRDAEIVQGFRGNNHAELADEWGVDPRRIYEVLSAERRRRMQHHYHQRPKHTKQQRPPRRAKAMRDRKKQKGLVRHAQPVDERQQTFDF